MKELDLHFLQAELNRISNWIRFSDRKSAFLSVYYSAILGLLISQKGRIIDILLKHQNWSLFFYGLLLLFIIFSLLIGMFFLLNSVFPRLRNPLTKKSLFYFGSVANMESLDYFKKMESLSEEEIKKQLTEQIYTNSVIANQKMKNVQKSTISLIILTFFLVLHLLT